MSPETESATARGDGATGTGRRAVVRRALSVAWVVVLVVALGLALRSRWDEVSGSLAELDVVPLLAAGVLALVGVGASAGIWHAMLRGIGEPLPLATSLRIFFVGQIGKYLPGSVWPAVTQAGLARSHGVAPRATVTAVTLFIWVHLVTGAAVGVGVLGGVGALPAWTLLALPAGAVLLAPPVLRRSLEGALRLARREPLRATPDGRHLATACAWAVGMWSCYGLHLHLLTVAVGDPAGVVRSTGVFAAAWCVGFVLLIAPAGAGPREAAMVALLGLPAGAGLVVALASRLVMTVVDGVWALAVTGARPWTVAASRRGVD